MTTEIVWEEVRAHLFRAWVTSVRLMAVDQMTRKPFVHDENGPWYPAKCGDVPRKPTLSELDGDEPYGGGYEVRPKV